MNLTDATPVYFCPECGSASINASALAGGLAECSNCKWTGPREKLVVTYIRQDFGSNEEIFKCLHSDLRGMLAKEQGLHFLKFLLKWGFMPEPDGKLLGRYLAAIARGIIKSILEERSALEQERMNGN